MEITKKIWLVDFAWVRACERTCDLYIKIEKTLNRGLGVWY